MPEMNGSAYFLSNLKTSVGEGVVREWGGIASKTRLMSPL